MLPERLAGRLADGACCRGWWPRPRHDQSGRDHLAHRRGRSATPTCTTWSPGSVEVLAGVFAGQGATPSDYGRFLLWATLGNAIGGPLFVAIIKYGHAIGELPRTHRVAEIRQSSGNRPRVAPFQSEPSHGRRDRPLRPEDAEGAGGQGGPRPLDAGRTELRRRHHLRHRRHPAEHRRHRDGGHSRACPRSICTTACSLTRRAATSS